MKIKIGIPRGFLYYRDYILFKNFFEGIGCTVLLSAPSNRSIIEDGKKLAVDESCLPFKIYLGHVKYLEDVNIIVDKDYSGKDRFIFITNCN